MKSLMTFVGILAFNLPNISIASDFSCPVDTNIPNYTCSGTVKVKTLAELNAYRNDLGVVAKKPTIAKNLQIDFNPALTSDLVISTPCLIKIPKDIVMTSTANICLHGMKGVSIDENFKFTGKNLKLESKEEVIINKNSVIKAQDIKLLSIGSGDASKTYIRDGANVEAVNLSIESFDKGFIGKNSIVKLTGALGIYSLGDDEASVREGARVEAAKIEISSTEETRIAKSTALIANEIILNGVKCTINKTAVITADDRLGNCFLTSTTNKAKFSINKNQGTNPLTVNFNGSSIADAKGFIWSFGDGETLNSLTPNVTHIYNRIGSFTATLKYATKDNYKGLKSAGAIQIDVREAPISNPVVPVPPRGNLKYQTDGTFVYLRGYIRKTTYDIANAYYVIDDNQDNKIQIPNFYQNSLTSVDMNTYGRHKVTMNVIDVQGLTHSKSMNVYVDENESDVYPYMRLDVDQSAARTMFFNLSWSFNPIAGETLKNFKIDFGDGQSAVLTDTAFITHTYAQTGTYLVRATGEVNGNEDFDEYEIEVTDENTPIMNPIAGFEYQIYDYAGNVMFTDDRSGTPNGEIISYAWDFGDGTVAYGKNASNFYAPGDYLVTLTVVDTAGLRSSQTQKITIVAEGDDIASMLDCWSDGSKHLGCDIVALDKFNQITRVKLDWGDGTSENLTVPDFASTGFSIREHNYESDGLFNLKLTIDTLRGKTKYVNYEHTVVSQPQNLPVAIMNCSVVNNSVNCDSFSSYSVGKNIIETNWDFGDGTTKSGDYVQHFYAGFGHFLVKMTVKDSSGLISEASQFVIMTEIAPIALGNCILSKQSVECDASDSYSLSGDITEYRWVITNELDQLGKKLSFEFTNAGYKEVKLFVKRNSLVAEKIINTYDIINLDPLPNFTCDYSIQTKLNCSAENAEDDNRIISYQWKINDTLVSNTTSFETPISSDGEYQVALTVTDNMGSQAVGVKSITLNPTSEWTKSLASIDNVIIEDRIFYPINGNLEFQVVNGRLGTALLNNHIYINDEEVMTEFLHYDLYNNTIKIDARLNDGQNTVRFELKDEFNKDIVQDKNIFAGSRDVEVGSSSLDEESLFNISLFSSGMADLGLDLKNVKQGFIVKNVPENTNFLIKMNSNTLTGNTVLFPESNSLDIKLFEKSDVMIEDNLNFQNGVTGWIVKDSSYDVSNGILKLGVGVDGTATLKKTMRANENNGVVSFEYKITSSYKDDYYYLLLKNRTTGEVTEEFLSTAQLGISENETVNVSSSFKITKAVKVSSPNDVIDIELRLFTKHNDDNVVLNNLLNFFIPAAIAESNNAISSETPGVLKQVAIIDVSLMSHNKTPLALISIGKLPIYVVSNREEIPFPTYYIGEEELYLSPAAIRPSNRIYFKVDTAGLDNLSPYKIRLKMYDSAQTEKSLPYRTITAVGSSIVKNDGIITGMFSIMDNHDELIEIPSQLRLELEIENFNGSKISKVIDNKVDLRPGNAKYNLKGQVFKTLVSMTAYHYYEERDRYLSRNADLGGDDWIRPELVDQAAAISGGDFGAPSDGTVGDLSYMNGGFATYPHKSHSLGLSIDAIFPGYIEGTPRIVKKRDTAKKIIRMLNGSKFLKNTESVYVAYEDKSDFDNEISQVCLDNGRMAKEVIKFDKNHGGHYHIELAPSVLDYKSSGKSFYIPGSEEPSRNYIVKIAKDLESIQLKEMNTNKNVKSDEFIVFAKLKTENDEGWVEMLPSEDSGANFLVPLKAKKSTFEVKVIYKGSNQKRCYADEGINVDLNETEKNYSCIEEGEFGKFKVYEYNSEIKASLFIGEQTLRNSPSLENNISFATRSDIDMNLFNKSAVCGNTTLSGLSFFYNMKITDSTIVAGAPSFINSEIEDSEMYSTLDEISRSPNGFENSIVKNTKVLKAAYAINSKISDSFLQDVEIYNSNVSNNSSLVRSEIYGSEGSINYVSEATAEESLINTARFIHSSAISSYIKAVNISNSNFTKTSLSNTSLQSITSSNFINTIIHGYIDSISSGSFNNNDIYFSKNIYFLGNWTGAFKSNTACGGYPAPPLMWQEEEDGVVYKIDKYCYPYDGGHEGFIPWYVQIGAWKRDPVLGRGN